MKVFHVCVLLLVHLVSRLDAAENPCPGKVPEYVLVGSAGMVLTSEAEEILCRATEGFEEWDGQLGIDNRAIIENQVIRAGILQEAVKHASLLEFRGCVFPDETYLTGAWESNLLFRECEFQGNLDIRDANAAGTFEFMGSVFHQNIHINDSTFLQPIVLAGSVLTGQIEIERSLLSGGLKLVGSRVSGAIHMSGMRSPVGLLFEGDRFLNSARFSDLELGGGVKFHDCEWDRGAVVDFAGGIISSGVRFDSCGFDGEWINSGLPHEISKEALLIRMSDLTVGSAVVLATASSRAFPQVRVSRCVIPFIKLPQWNLARDIVLRTGALSANEAEDTGELLQLVQESYESQGRTRDASRVRQQLRRLRAEMVGGPVSWIERSRGLFGTGLWWFFTVLILFSVVFYIKGDDWRLVRPDDNIISRLYKALDWSIRGFLMGPPERSGRHSLHPAARRWLMTQRLIGMLFFFLLGLLLNEWIAGHPS